MEIININGRKGVLGKYVRYVCIKMGIIENMIGNILCIKEGLIKYVLFVKRNMYEYENKNKERL